MLGSNIILGTAQVGLPYGIKNSFGKPKIGEVKELLDFAFDKGITTLDTAAAYGSSEEVLGLCGIDRWSVITKLSSMKEIEKKDLSKTIRKNLLISFERLKVSSLYGVLAHDHRDLEGERGRYFLEALEPFLSSGAINKIGVSVYAPGDLQNIVTTERKIVQFPLNIFDQRFVRSHALSKLILEGSELHARSVFLQGLLLIPQAERPQAFHKWKHHFKKFDLVIENSGTDALSFCLNYALSQSELSKIVIGVDTISQLDNILDVQTKRYHAKRAYEDLQSNSLSLIDPRKWSLQ